MSPKTEASPTALLPCVDAVEIVTRRRMHKKTVLRWNLKGVRGVRLESVILGGRRVCTVDQVKRFIAATTAARDGVAAPHCVPAPVGTPNLVLGK